MNGKNTILYVDDEPINILLFKFNFKLKYNLITAQSGFEGLEMLSAHPEIDIVITDMKMPSMNGIEFISIAKLRFPEVKFFIVTGLDIIPEIEHALSTSLIIKYFCKPLKIDEIQETISYYSY